MVWLSLLSNAVTRKLNELVCVVWGSKVHRRYLDLLEVHIKMLCYLLW